MNAFRFLSFTASDALSVFVRKAVKSTLKLRWLFLFLCLTVLGFAKAATESVTFSAQGYSNQQAISSYSGTDFSVSFSKGSNSNAPKYFTNGSAIRCYGGNTFTVSSTTKTITGITLTFGSSDGSNAITASTGSFTSPTWSGSATSVTFTIGGSSGNRRLAGITVTYQSSSIAVTGVSLSESSKALYVGESFNLTATVTPSNATNKSISWSSNNTNVATVNNGTVTAVAPGDATITVTTQDGSKTATCLVTVSALPTYTVTLDAGDGSVASATLTTTNSKVTLISATPSAACSSLGWTFVGWSESTVSETTTAPTLLTAGTEYTPAGDITLYAVYSLTESDGGNTDVYTKVTDTDDITDGQYLIVYENGNVAFDGGRSTLDATSNTISVSISNDEIAVTQTTEAAEFTIATETENNVTIRTIKSASEKYIGRTATSNGLNSDSNTKYTHTLSIDNNDNFVDESSAGPTLRYNSNSDQRRFRYFASGQQAIQLYKKSGSVTTYTTSPSCTGTVTLTYDANGANSGTAPTDSNSPYSISATVTVLDNSGNLAKTNGTAFFGWNTKADGTGTTYKEGDTFTISKNTTLYALWLTPCTITIIDNGTTTAINNFPSGSKYTLPEEGASSCDEIKLLGWATGEYANHAAGTSTDPGYDAPGAEVTVSGNTTFTAVYGEETLSDKYVLLDYESELESGAEYLIAAYYNSYDYPVKASTSNERIDAEHTSLDATDEGAQVTDESLIWIITVTNSANKRVTIYNADAGKYLVINASNELVLQDSPVEFAYTAVKSGTNAVNWNFYSVSNANYMLSFFRNHSQYNAYTSCSDNIYLYKRKYEIASYTSKPNCCSAPATKLALTSDAESFVGNGEAHISVSGGNGKNITWSVTDEGNTAHDEYLSNQSNSGATVTLPAAGATKRYTVTATQPDDDTDVNNVICGATASINIDVKAQWTIVFNAKDNGNVSEHSRIIVTDGNSYTMPDISDEYTCSTGSSFAGWVNDISHTSVDAAAGSSQTASADVTWYAAWAGTAGTTDVPLYEKVTTVSSLAAGDKVIIANTAGNKGLGAQNENNRAAATLSTNPNNDSQVYFTGSDVMELTVGKTGDYYTFHDGTGYLYAASSTKNYLKRQTTNNTNGQFEISISNGAATITAQGDNSHNILRYNSTSVIFSCYASGQQAVSIYKRTNSTISADIASSGVTTNNTTCDKGTTIIAESGKWITSSKGQKVRITIPVSARGYESTTTLTISNISGANFTASLASNVSIPVAPAYLQTTLTVEYTPANDDFYEDATITLADAAGIATKTITVHGRSVPAEFALITKSNGWYALPANMNSGMGQYNGIGVVPNDDTAPDMLPVGPSTVVYNMRGVADARYENAGECVRLVGNSNKCLWISSTSNATSIQNYAQMGSTNGDQYEWLLTTTNGVKYTITAPVRAAETTRQLTLAANKFGYYIGTADFYIVPIGCSSQPQNVKATPHRIMATLAWVSNAASMTVNVYSDAERTTLVKTVTATSSPAIIDGLTEKTHYYYRLTPDGATDCAVIGDFETTGPYIDIVEWDDDAVIIQVDHNEALQPKIIIDGETEHGSISSATATELFFAKYFEGAGSMKLLSIFNGTMNAISLADYSIVDLHSKDLAYGTEKTYELATLGSIAAGQEIILFSRPLASETELSSCSSSFINSMATKSDASENPRWIECGGTGSTFSSAMNFNGDDALLLMKGNNVIDVIGAQESLSGIRKNDCRQKEYSWHGTVKNMDYGKTATDYPDITLGSGETLSDYGINTTDEEIDITTARCILFRSNEVKSGENAVNSNTDDFSTFTPAEWVGRSICGTTLAAEASATCNSYEDLGLFDYSDYYREYDNHLAGEELNNFIHNAAEQTYKIDIDNLQNYACLGLRFQLTKEGNEGVEVLTEQYAQVPIIVAANDATTSDIFTKVVHDDNASDEQIYQFSKQRCKDCSVVILGGAKLTKAADNATHDVNEVHDIKVYPGGQLVVPAGTNYTVNSLALRRQEDAVPTVDIKGTLNAAEGKSVYLDIRIDPTNWHYITLPYDCRVEDITFSNGEEAELGTDYLLRWYDGAYRAEHRDGGWTDVNADATLKKGLGYIIGIPGDGAVKREIRLPMSVDAIADEQENKTVGELYGYGAGKSEEELRWNHRGWNLIGNPYMNFYNASSITTPLLQGTLEMEYNALGNWTGNWELNTDADAGKNLRYVVAPVNNGWSGYVQRQIGDNLEPFTCYFVQVSANDETTPQGISFLKDNVHNFNSAPRRGTTANGNDITWFGIQLTAPNAESDKTALLIGQQFTDGYDMMDDLIKMRGSYYKYYQIPVIASRNNDGEMAFNALPAATAAAGVPVNFYAPQNGEYVISRNTSYDTDNIEEAWLYDAVEQTWNDILNNDYYFTAAKGDNTTRFTLTVTLRQQSDTPTGIDEVNNNIHATAENGGIKVTNIPVGAQMWIYSTDGKLLYNGTPESNTAEIPVPATGVYNIRIATPAKASIIKCIVR